jgi:hypothetical protein
MKLSSVIRDMEWAVFLRYDLGVRHMIDDEPDPRVNG